MSEFFLSLLPHLSTEVLLLGLYKLQFKPHRNITCPFFPDKGDKLVCINPTSLFLSQHCQAILGGFPSPAMPRINQNLHCFVESERKAENKAREGKWTELAGNMDNTWTVFGWKLKTNSNWRGCAKHQQDKETRKKTESLRSNWSFLLVES